MGKIIILGSYGMAGHVIFDHFSALQNYSVVDIAKGRKGFKRQPTYDLDVTNFVALSEIIAAEQPDYIINCIGILNKDAEENIDKAILLNSYLPHFLAKTINKSGGKLIQISTDCVFNGKSGNYNEESIKDGIGYYAQTKALGEVVDNKNITLRTSIIGPELNNEGIGLFNWFMRQQGNIKGFSKAIWTGITTLALAKAVEKSIENDLTGLLHVVNGDKISKYELLQQIAKTFKKKDLIIREDDNYSIDKSLCSSKKFDFDVPSYAIMISELKDYIEHKEIEEYKKYKL
jgi:dTDP-4-dehydrorhamnose reductase